MELSEHIQGRILSAPVFIRQIEEKILAGEYLFEDAPCICGSSNEIELSRSDRDQLGHRLVICAECALVRANPRMTADSFRRYYNAEYLDLNVGRDIIPDHDTKVYMTIDEPESGFKAQYNSGKSLINWLDENDIALPKVVVEIGSRWGGLLQAFKDEGSEQIWGVDFGDVAAQPSYWAYQNVDELVTLRVQADLIVMQGTLDHLSDLGELKKIKSLLKPDGLLYVQTPGFFSKDPNVFVCMGRNYHFCHSTLAYVMSQFDFEEFYADEEIRSLWRHRGYEDVFTSPWKPVEWVQHSLDYLFKKDGEERKSPPFRGQCKFSRKLLYSNARKNLSQGIPDLRELTGKDFGQVVIVAGGPSVDGQVDNIKWLKGCGYPVIAIARMYPWCLDHDIIPDYCISLDCSSEQESCFTRLNTKTKFLLASFSRPSIVKRTEAYNRYIFDTQDTRKLKEIRREQGYDVCTIVNAGGSVAINALSLAMNLGYSELHVFGLDLMVQKQEQTHATGITGKSVEFDFCTVTVKGEEVLTTPSFLDFTEQTLDFISCGHDAGLLKSIKFYGESFINKVWDGQWHEEEGTDVAVKS